MSHQNTSIFKEKIYTDFERNLHRVLGMSLHEFNGVFNQEEHSPFKEYEAAYDSGGPQKMRFYMNWSISNLSIIHKEQGLGRSMTDEEKTLHRIELGLGF